MKSLLSKIIDGLQRPLRELGVGLQAITDDRIAYIKSLVMAGDVERLDVALADAVKALSSHRSVDGYGWVWSTWVSSLPCHEWLPLFEDGGRSAEVFDTLYRWADKSGLFKPTQTKSGLLGSPSVGAAWLHAADALGKTEVFEKLTTTPWMREKMCVAYANHALSTTNRTDITALSVDHKNRCVQAVLKNTKFLKNLNQEKTEDLVRLVRSGPKILAAIFQEQTIFRNGQWEESLAAVLVKAVNDRNKWYEYQALRKNHVSLVCGKWETHTANGQEFEAALRVFKDHAGEKLNYNHACDKGFVDKDTLLDVMRQAHSFIYFGQMIATEKSESNKLLEEWIAAQEARQRKRDALQMCEENINGSHKPKQRREKP